jgi:asparagine synthase (glutamine-hydrolysing)
MPGIVGLVTKMPRERAERELLSMVAAIRHDSFYTTGTWIHEPFGVYVGWAARENSFCDRMPVRNERGEVVLVFSGEEFSEPGTANRLKAEGHELDTEGPSYLVHRYEEDPAFPAGLNGRYQGLLVDEPRGTMMLFNDRYGMHRFYYCESKNAFYFAAEAKAILTVRPEVRKVDPRGLGEFIACGCVLENRTLFQGIQELPPAAAWVFRNGSIERKGTYFHPREWEEQPPLEPESYYKEIRQIFSTKLPRYFNGHQRIGMSLTGGLDTRMIMAWQDFPAGSLPCYTFGGTYRDCRDVTVARQVAKVCRQPHKVISVGEEFLSHFPYYAERCVYLSDGCADVSRSPALYANQKARETAPVRMTGVYGSEVLRGLRSFKPSEPTPGIFRPEFLQQVHAAGDSYSGLLKLHPVSFTVFRQTPQRGVDALEQTQVDVRSPFLDNDIVRTAFRAPDLGITKRDALPNNNVCLRLIADGNPALRPIPTDRGLGGALGGISAAVSRAFLEFTFKSEYAYDYGMPQSVARIDHLFSAFHLERLFLGRHKFNHFRVWYRDSLSRYVQEMLLDPRTLARPYLEKGGVERVVRGHLKGNCNYTTEIHQLLSLELLHRLFLDAR